MPRGIGVSGVHGISKLHDGWIVRIVINGKRKYIGYTPDLEVAKRMLKLVTKK